MQKNFDELKQEADIFYNNEEYESALKIYQSLLEKEKDLTDSEVANLQNDIAYCYYYLKEYEKAEKYFKIFLLYLNKQTEPDKNQIAITLLNTGNTLSNNLKMEEAIENYLASLNIYLGISDEESENIITINREIGQCYYYLKLYSKAGPFYFKAKNIAENIFGIEDEFTNYCRFDLAENLYYEGKTKEAYDEFVLVYLYFEEGNQYVNKIDVLDHLTNLCFEIPVNENQENYYKQLYVEAEKSHGPESIDVAISAKKCGRFYNRMKNYVNAAKYFDIAHTVYKKLKGEISPETINISSWLATAYYNAKQYEKAKGIYEFILSNQRRRYKDNEVPLLEAITNMAYTCSRTKDYKNAEKLFEEALYISNKIPETPLSEINTYKLWYTDALYENGDYQKASVALKRFIKEKTERDSPDEKILIQFYDYLAKNLAEIKNKAPEAELYRLKIIEFYKNNLEENEPKFLEQKLKLAKLYIHELSNSKRALEILNEILEIINKHQLQNAFIYYKTLVQAGKAYRNEENYKIALDHFQRAQEYITKSKGNGVGWRVSLLQDFAITEIAMGKKESAFSTLKERARLSKEYYGTKKELNKEIIKFVKDNYDEKTGREIIGNSHYGNALKEYNAFVKSELYADTNKRNVRVFISSTFRDMMSERDYLMKNIFPEIKQVCKQYGIDFTEIDLRWGVTNEDVEQGKIIEICLNEIDKSRPYFIGILGERYGWIPDNSILPKIERTLENFDWLNQDFNDQLSITEMEIQYGVLRNKKMKGNAFFYLRDKELTPDNIDFFEKEDSLEFNKLLKLKKTLLGQNKYPVKEFKSLNDLGELIANDLQKVIIRDTKLDRTVSNREGWGISQLNYIRQFCEFYIPLEENLKQLDEFASSSLNKAVIYAPSGKGKSALLSYWIKERFKQRDNSPILFHFSLAVDDSNTSTLFWWLSKELSKIFSTQNLFNNDNDDPAGEFLNVIKDSHITSDVIIVIDGIENIQQHTFFAKLYWLPLDIPANIKLIISTNDKAYSDILKDRDYAEIVPVEMNDAQKKKFIIHYLRRFGKKLPDSLIKKMVKDEVSNSPFSLKIILDELRIMGKHEELESVLANYLSAKNTKELNFKVLERIELDYDKDFPGLTSKALSFLAISRFGLRENEIIELTNSARLFWSPIKNSLENYFTITTDKIRISNQHFLEAIKEKYLPEESEVKGYKSMLANYLLKADNLSGKEEELSELFYELGDKKNLAHLITNIKVLDHLITSRYEDLYRYYNLIKDDFNVVEFLKNNLEKGKLADDDKVELIEPLLRISQFLLGDYKSADALFFAEESFKIAKSFFGEKHPNTAKPILRMAAIYSSYLNNKLKAKKLYLKAIAIIEGNPYKMGTKFANTYISLAELYLKEDNIAEARKYALKEKEYLQAIYSAGNVAFTRMYNLLGKIELKNENYEEAEGYIKKALGIAKLNLGEENVLYQFSILNLVEVYNKKGDNIKALELLIESEKVLSEKLGEDNASTLGIKADLASKYCDLKEYDKAEKLSLKVVELASNNNQFDTSNLDLVLYVLKDIYRLEHITADKLKESKEHFSQAVGGFDRLNIITNESAELYSLIGDIFYLLKDYNKAEKISLKLLEIAIKNNQFESSIFSMALYNLENIYRLNHIVGDKFIERKKCFNRAISGISMQSCNTVESAKNYSHVGDIYYHFKDYNNAIIFYEEALTYYNNLPEKDKKKISSIYAKLSSSYSSQGRYYYYHENYDQAIVNYQKAHESYSKLDATYSDLADFAMQNLGKSYNSANKYSKAIACYSNSLKAGKKIYGEDSKEYDSTLHDLGRSYKNAKMYSEAIACFTASLNTQKKLHGEVSAEVDSARFNLGESYHDAEMYSKAIACFTALLDTRKRLYKEETTAVDYARFKLGQSYYCANMSNEAIECFTVSLNDRKKIFGEDTDKVGLARYWLGLSFLSADRYNEAIECFTVLHNTWKKLYGEDSKEVDSARFRLGRSFYSSDRYKEAIACFSASLEVRKKLYREDSEKVDSARFWLGRSFYFADKYSEAVECLTASIETRKKLYGEDSEEVDSARFLLGNSYYCEGMYNEAIACYTTSLKARKKLYGEDPERVDVARYWLGDSYYYEGMYNEAIECYTTSLKARKKLYGEDSKEVDRVRFDLGLSFYNVDKYSEAIACFSASLEVRKKLHGEDSEEVDSARSNLGQSYIFANMSNEAIECFSASLEVMKKLYGEDSEEVDLARSWLGVSFYNVDKYNEAIECYTISLEVRKKLYGEDSEEVDSARFNLGESYYYADMYNDAIGCFTPSLEFRKQFYGEESEEYKIVKELLEKISDQP